MTDQPDTHDGERQDLRPADLLQAIRDEHAARAASWAPWQLDAKDRSLCEPDGYYVDLEDCTTSAHLLDWIFQVARKSWADDRAIAGLVRALDDVLHPQAHLCSSGVSRS